MEYVRSNQAKQRVVVFSAENGGDGLAVINRMNRRLGRNIDLLAHTDKRGIVIGLYGAWNHKRHMLPPDTLNDVEKLDQAVRKLVPKPDKETVLVVPPGGHAYEVIPLAAGGRIKRAMNRKRIREADAYYSDPARY